MYIAKIINHICVGLPSDTKFLLSFLRISKFSQLTARERLINFLASFNDSVSYLNGHDPADPKFLKILRDR